jgi:amino acid adenylation domain-containing protein
MLDTVDFRSLRSDVLARAAELPSANALVVSGRSITYGELAYRARQLAAMITRRGERTVERVGVFASRSEVAYVGTLGALCSGAAFVPLNVRFPVERTRAMVRRAALNAIVVDRGSAPQLAAVLRNVEQPPLVIAPEPGVAESLTEQGVPALGSSELVREEPLSELPAVQPDDVAYLLFTSGTTGEPKGVGVTHANALHFLDVMSARYQLTPTDRCSQTFDHTFDLSVFDIFMTWRAGACLCVAQPVDLLAPVGFVRRHQLTLWFSVPSVAALCVKRGALLPDRMPSLRYSLFCGEPLPEAIAQAWHTAAPGSVIENLYGPTELTIACFVHRWAPSEPTSQMGNGIVQIGRPLPGLGALVVDDNLRPLPSGETGELLVCGPQTVPGYWNDPAKTAERFVEIETSPTRRKRFYRTGDRVVRAPGGDYIYIGRTDHQIKVLGFRVELGEIESVLLGQDGVVQAAAVGWPWEDGRALGIVAFVSGRVASAESLIQAAAKVLPDYMVPSRIVLLEELPLNANGKIDRALLHSHFTAELAAV